MITSYRTLFTLCALFSVSLIVVTHLSAVIDTSAKEEIARIEAELIKIKTKELEDKIIKRKLHQKLKKLLKQDMESPYIGRSHAADDIPEQVDEYVRRTSTANQQKQLSNYQQDLDMLRETDLAKGY